MDAGSNGWISVGQSTKHIIGARQRLALLKYNTGILGLVSRTDVQNALFLQQVILKFTLSPQNYAVLHQFFGSSVPEQLDLNCDLSRHRTGFVNGAFPGMSR